MLHSFAESHIGQRKVNEDQFLIDQELDLYIVADGVGGMAKGEVASSLACTIITKSVQSGMNLKEAVYVAHKEIVNEIKLDPDKQGMATTIVAALFKGNAYDLAWVGDSRAYVWDNQLKLISRDDSYVERLLEHGHIGIDELETHPDRNVISQALGIVRKDIKINHNSGTLEKNQKLLLCSDGLYSIANEQNIIESIKKNIDVQNLTQSLVAKAVEKEGKDNITLLSISSNHDTKDINNIVKPKVFRKFDCNTGKAKETRTLDNTKRIEKDVSLKEDPELVDQTEFTNMTHENRNLLDTAARQFVDKKKPSGYLIPYLLTAVLGLVGLFIYLN